MVLSILAGFLSAQAITCLFACPPIGETANGRARMQDEEGMALLLGTAIWTSCWGCSS